MHSPSIFTSGQSSSTPIQDKNLNPYKETSRRAPSLSQQDTLKASPDPSDAPKLSLVSPVGTTTGDLACTGSLSARGIS